MKIVSKALIAALVVLGSTASTVSADERIGLTRHELGLLRLMHATDRNQDGRVSAEEILRTRPDAYDRNGDGVLDARERGVALQQLRRARFR